MRSPTSFEDSWLVRIVVPCARTSLRLPGPSAIEVHSRALELERAAQASRVSVAERHTCTMIFFFQGDLNTKQKKKNVQNHHIVEVDA